MSNWKQLIAGLVLAIALLGPATAQGQPPAGTVAPGHSPAQDAQTAPADSPAQSLPPAGTTAPPTTSRPGNGYRTKVDGHTVQVQAQPAAATQTQQGAAAAEADTPVGKSPFHGVGDFRKGYTDTFRKGMSGRKQTEEALNGNAQRNFGGNASHPGHHASPPVRPVVVNHTYVVHDRPAYAGSSGVSSRELHNRLVAAMELLRIAQQKGDKETLKAAQKIVDEAMEGLDTKISELSTRLDTEIADRTRANVDQTVALSRAIVGIRGELVVAIEQLRRELQAAKSAGDTTKADRLQKAIDELTKRVESLEAAAAKASAAAALPPQGESEPSVSSGEKNERGRKPMEGYGYFLAWGLAALFLIFVVVCLVGAAIALNRMANALMARPNTPAGDGGNTRQNNTPAPGAAPRGFDIGAITPQVQQGREVFVYNSDISSALWVGGAAQTPAAPAADTTAAIRAAADIFQAGFNASRPAALPPATNPLDGLGEVSWLRQEVGTANKLQRELLVRYLPDPHQLSLLGNGSTQHHTAAPAPAPGAAAGTN